MLPSLTCCTTPFKQTLVTLAKIPIDAASAIFSLCRVSNTSKNCAFNVIDKKNNVGSNLSDQIINQSPTLIELNKEASVIANQQLDWLQTMPPALTEKKSKPHSIDEGKALTDDEVEAIIFYCSDNYYELNAGFTDKRCVSFYAKKNADLKVAITKLSHGELIKTFRGDHGNYFDSLYEGSLWKPNKFLSTSKQSRKAYIYANGRCFIVIFGQTGADISAISWMHEEQEVLYNKGSQFRIVFRHQYSENSPATVSGNTANKKNLVPNKYQIIEEAGLPDGTGQTKDLINALCLAILPSKGNEVAKKTNT